MFVNDIFKKKQLDEGGPFSYGAKKPRKGSVADLAARKRKEQERGKQPAEPRDHMVGVARVKKDVAESISVVDQDYDLDQIILTLDIEGKRVSFTYWDYDENFANAKRQDVFDQLQQQPWYAKLDHPTRMEILDAAYRAIRGLEPQEYRPTVRDEPLDEQGVAEGSGENTNDSFVQKLSARLQQLGYTQTQEGNVYRWIGSNGTFVEVEPNTEDPGWYGWAEGQVTKSGKLNYGDSGNDSAKDIVAIFKSGGVFRKQGVAEGYTPSAGELAKDLRKMSDSDFSKKYGMSKQQANQHYSSSKLKEQGVAEGSAQEKLYKRHQELRKKSGLPDPDYYKELKTTYDLPDNERHAKQKEIKQKYKVTNEDREQYIEELERAGYEIVTEKRMTCPECGGAAYSDRMLAEKQDACYHKVKSRYKVWPSAYASGALVRCRKVGAKNWGNKSKK